MSQHCQIISNQIKIRGTLDGPSAGFLESTGTFIDLKTEQPEARIADSESDRQSIYYYKRELPRPCRKELESRLLGGLRAKARPAWCLCACARACHGARRCHCGSGGGGGGVTGRSNLKTEDPEPEGGLQFRLRPSLTGRIRLSGSLSRPGTTSLAGGGLRVPGLGRPTARSGQVY
jgi:hypothetical protein